MGGGLENHCIGHVYGVDGASISRYFMRKMHGQTTIKHSKNVGPTQRKTPNVLVTKTNQLI